MVTEATAAAEAARGHAQSASESADRSAGHAESAARSAQRSAEKHTETANLVMSIEHTVGAMQVSLDEMRRDQKSTSSAIAVGFASLREQLRAAPTTRPQLATLSEDDFEITEHGQNVRATVPKKRFDKAMRQYENAVIVARWKWALRVAQAIFVAAAALGVESLVKFLLHRV